MTFSRELDQKLVVKVSLFEYQKPFSFLHLASVRIELISSMQLFFLQEIYKTYNVENSPNLGFWSPFTYHFVDLFEMYT